MLETIVSIVLTALLTLLLLSLYVKRTLPNILEDVAIGAGESITEKLKETFENPNVKRAFSILGNKSGEARADKALQNKAANAVVGQSPVISLALEKIGITPLEGLKLMNDPIFGPTIQGMIASFTQGQKKTGSNKAVGRM